MSLAQILEEVKAFPTSELASLEQSLRLERLRRDGRVSNGAETRLLVIVNEPFVLTEGLRELRAKRERQTLSEAEHAELIERENEREILWARKLRAVAELADLRGESFDALYQKSGLALRADS